MPPKVVLSELLEPEEPEVVLMGMVVAAVMTRHARAI